MTKTTLQVFKYNAVAVDGLPVSGNIQAESQAHAKKLLREKNLFPLEVTPLRPLKGSLACG